MDTLEQGHWQTIDFKQRCLIKEVQKILINQPTIVFKARVYQIKSHHIGAGVYEVYKDLSIPAIEVFPKK